MEAIEKSRKVTLPRLIISLSIPQVGEETAYDLAENFKNIKNLSEASFEELEALNGVGPIVAKSIRDWFDDKNNQKILEKLLDNIYITKDSLSEKKSVSSDFSGKTFVLTGTLSTMSRDEAKEKIRAMGGNVSSSVSTNTDFVIAGENPGSKLDNAEKMGVKIIDEDSFVKMLTK